MTDKHSMDTFVSLCKRRGFVFQSSEIYGGLGGFWDYGPLGVELKNNIKRSWWRNTVQERADVVGIETSIIMNPRVWEASGHVKTFADPMVDCKDCQHRFRTDDVKADDKGAIRCPDCGGELTDSRMFNLMFKTFIGPVADDASVAYLRPETAQGMFVNFDNVLTTMRKKLPFGIAQIGRSFRNEITPGNFIFRDREFEQMEMEFFVMPGSDEEWHDRWIETRMNWWTDDLGIRKENLKLREHPTEELSHYSKRTVLRLKPHLAPIKVAVLPLSRNEKLVPTAQHVHEVLRPHFMTQFDDAQSIGRRYRRQDEIGTPYCVTVDFDTIDDDAVTIRDRDTMAQERVPVANLPDVLREKLPAV